MKINGQNIPYFTFFVSPISDEKVNEIFKKRDKGVIHYLKVNNKEWSSVIIQKETLLFSYKSPLESIEDIGNDIEEASNIHSLEDLNTLNKRNNNYFAGSNGLLVKYDGVIKFIQITNDGTCEIEISDDNNLATAKFYPPVNGGKELTKNDVVEIIREKGITVDLEVIEINSSLDWVNKSGEILDQVVVAKGKPIKLGKESWTEYLFDTERRTGPVVSENGTVDYYNMNLIESVSKNQRVGILHPMIESEDGCNLFGTIITAPKLKDNKPPTGQNIYYPDKNPTHILSKIDGHITLVGNEIIITNLYSVRGDVDFNTGNIVCKGSLNVTGNVKSGFNIDMSESITIGGYVKDANLTSKGDVVIRGGFSGTGEGTITADGNVSIRYLRYQTIYSRGDISIEREVVEATLFAKGDIKSTTNKMLLIGGHAIAGGSVIVKTLGHEYGMETKVEVGYDYYVRDQIDENDKERKQIKKDLIKLKKQIEITLANGVVSKLSKALLIKYKMMKKNYDVLKSKRKELRDRINTPSGSKVIVSGKIHPGVIIYIDGYKINVKEIMESKIFYASADEEKIIITDK